jgi:thioester reductase-like protein
MLRGHLFQIIADSGIQATSVRIGQIAGGDGTGAWSTTDWVPILLKSGLRMGSLPSSAKVRGVFCFNFYCAYAAQVVTWTPSQVVAGSIIDLCWSSSVTPVVNLKNPRTVPWNTVMKWILSAMEAYGISVQNVRLIPVQDWFAQLDVLASNAEPSDYDEVVSVIGSKLMLAINSPLTIY